MAKYESYRAYLKDLFDFKKSINPGLSFRRFGQVAGFKSPNYLQLIIEGKRNLSNETAATLAHRLKLNATERRLFVALVRIENAANEQDKRDAERDRLACLREMFSKDIPVAQSKVLSEWYHLLVRELFLLKDARPTAEWISRRLGGLISPEEAEESVVLLLQSGFLKFEDGRYEVTDPVLNTNELDFHHAFMQKHHASLLAVWSRSLERMAAPEQELGVLNIPIHSSKLPELRRRIRRFQDEIIGWVQDEKAADRVVQLGTYLLPYPADEQA